MKPRLFLRIVVVDAPSGTTFALQQGRSDLVAPPESRFVYVNSGTMAGQADSCWTRRAKVPLTGINATLLRSALAGNGRILEARIAGKARDGGPACATVPLLGVWAVAD